MCCAAFCGNLRRYLDTSSAPFLSQVTTGAGGDLQQVERMARAMVTQFGMSDVGSIAIDDGGFMGSGPLVSWICTRLLGCWALVVRPNYSEELGTKIDQAIRGISDECYLNSLTILMNHRACLDALADELVEVSHPGSDATLRLLMLTACSSALESIGHIDPPRWRLSPVIGSGRSLPAILRSLRSWRQSERGERPTVCQFVTIPAPGFSGPFLG